MTNAKEKKKIVLWLIVLAILAAAAFTVTAIVRHNQRPAWDGGYSVHISEVMTDNKTCPNGEGVLCDWIEIENTTSPSADTISLTRRAKANTASRRGRSSRRGGISSCGARRTRKATMRPSPCARRAGRRCAL